MMTITITVTQSEMAGRVVYHVSADNICGDPPAWSDGPFANRENAVQVMKGAALLGLGTIPDEIRFVYINRKKE